MRLEPTGSIAPLAGGRLEYLTLSDHPMSAVASRVIPWPAGASEPRIARGARSRTEAFASGRVVSLDTDDVDEFNQYAAGWSIQYHVLDATAFRSTVFLVMTPSLQVALVQHAMGYSSQGENPAGTVSFAVPVDDARPMTHRGHGIGPTQMGVTRSGEGYEIVGRAGAHFVVASVAQEEAKRYAADLWRESGLRRPTPDRLRFLDCAHRSAYLDACGRILGVVDEQPSVLADQRAVALLEEKFLESLFLNASVAPSRADDPRRSSLARQAYHFLRDRADAVPSIREVCAVTRASYATLERGFRELYGMTPKAMMTAMRLSGVRRALLHPSPTTTVTSVALRWGFVELGRFSVQYRRSYGEVPSETLRRVRGQLPPAERSDRNSTRSPGPTRLAGGCADENGSAARL